MKNQKAQVKASISFESRSLLTRAISRAKELHGKAHFSYYVRKLIEADLASVSK